jgi:hypothetical protein
MRERSSAMPQLRFRSFRRLLGSGFAGQDAPEAKPQIRERQCEKVCEFEILERSL